MRLGFEIDNWSETIDKLKEDPKVEFLTEPIQTDFGFMSIIKDPDGRKIELYRKKIKAIRIEIVGFVDDHQPGFVSCRFKDAWEREHTIIDKVPIFSTIHLDRNSLYPQEGIIGCELVREWMDCNGRTINTVNSGKPWGIETTEGLTEFDILKEQLIVVNR